MLRKIGKIWAHPLTNGEICRGVPRIFWGGGGLWSPTSSELHQVTHCRPCRRYTKLHPSPIDIIHNTTSHFGKKRIINMIEKAKNSHFTIHILISIHILKKFNLYRAYFGWGGGTPGQGWRAERPKLASKI